MSRFAIGGPLGEKFNDMSHFDHFWESQLKGDPNLQGHPEKFNIGFFSQTFWESQYMLGSQEKKLGEKPDVKFFRVVS